LRFFFVCTGTTLRALALLFEACASGGFQTSVYRSAANTVDETSKGNTMRRWGFKAIAP
jgi:hypothetical protein